MIDRCYNIVFIFFYFNLCYLNGIVRLEGVFCCIFLGEVKEKRKMWSYNVFKMEIICRMFEIDCCKKVKYIR